MIRNRGTARVRRSRNEEGERKDRPPRISHVLTFFCSSLLPIALAAGGCATATSHEERHYILEAVREGNAVRPARVGSLEVLRFSVDTAFAGKNLIYRLGELQYEADYYHQFLVAPGIMITEKTRRWLADSGLFHNVVPVGTRIAADYTLEGNVTALYGDFANESAPVAVMEVRFFLLENAGGGENAVFAETYKAASPVPSRAADDFIDAMNRSLVEILGRLETDLQKVLAGKTEAAGNSRNP